MIDEIREKGKAVGDCDDHVILWAALHKVLGNPVRFRVISQRPDQYANHIYGEVYIPRHGWVADELIVKDRPLGWKIPAGEITKSVVFLGALNLGGYAMSDMDEIFPGGAFLASRSELLPPSARLAVDPFAAAAYRIKQGGAAIAEEGGGVGFIPATITAAAPAVKSVAKMLRKAKKKKKIKTSASEPPAQPEPKQEKKGGIGPLLWVTLGGLAFFALLIYKRK
jgi:hypothetical protein